jgi:hypothetical protein
MPGTEIFRASSIIVESTRASKQPHRTMDCRIKSGNDEIGRARRR